MLSLKKIKSEGKNFAIYGIGNISQTAIGFLLLPLYLKYFTPVEYGAIGMFFLIISLFSMFASAGLMSALHRLYFSVKKEERKKLVGTTFAWHIALGGVIGGTIIIASPFISKLLFDGQGDLFRRATALTGIYFALSFPLDLPFNVLRLEKKAIKYVILSLLRLLVDFSLKIYFIVMLKHGVEGYLESSIITLVVILVVSFYLIRKYVTYVLNKEFLVQLLQLGIPFVFSGFAIWSLNVVDRFLINMWWGASAVGIYFTALKFSQIFNILLNTPFSLLLPPTILSYEAKHSVKDTKKILIVLLKVIIVSGGTLYVAIGLMSRDFIVILVNYFGVQKDYIHSTPLIPILLIAPFLYLLEKPAGYSILIAKKPKYTAFAASIAAGVNVCLSLLLIPHMRGIGAAISTVISYFTYVGFVYYWAGKVYKIEFPWRVLFFMLFVIMSIVIGLGLIIFENPWFGLVFHSFVGIFTFVIFVWFFSGIINEGNKADILRYLLKKKRTFFTSSNIK